MAEDVLNAAETATAEASGTDSQALSSASVETPVHSQGSGSGILSVLGILAVGLTVLGVFGQLSDHPSHLPLGLGLILWGLLDILAQRRGLLAWKGQKALGHSVNLGRAVALMLIGVWLCGMSVGAFPAQNSAMVVTTLVGLGTIYLGIALGLDTFVKGLRLSPQAFLLAALALMFASYVYFTVPFRFSLAAIFALVAYSLAAWSAYTGVIKQNPSLAPAVLVAVFLLGVPQGIYTVQELFFTPEQPLFTPTLIIPRMRQVVGGLGPEVANITWAPVHTVNSQPGDVPFSDKIAFTDLRDRHQGVGIFVQNEDGIGSLAWIETESKAKILGFSQDGATLALNLGGSAANSLAVLQPSKKAGSAYTLNTLVKGPVEPGPSHGQVWKDLGAQLYYAAPAGGPKNLASAVYRADFKTPQIQRIREGRSYPAVSPDGKSLLTVGFMPNERLFVVADGTEGSSHERRFSAAKESHLFPAWSARQDTVLFMRGGKLKVMNANGTGVRDFDPEAPLSRVWLTDKTRPFTLQWKETGDRFQVWRSKADGTAESIIYETWGDDITPPQWSADGKRVAFAVRYGETSSIYTLESDGQWPRRFFVSKDPIRELKFSPDSLHLAWLCSRPEGEQEAWTAGVEGLDPKRVYDSHAQLSSLTWSPAGGHIAFSEDKGWKILGLRLIKPDLQNVVMVELARNRALVMSRYGIKARQPSFSPQGITVAYVTDEKPWAFFGRRRQSLVISQLY